MQTGRDGMTHSQPQLRANKLLSRHAAALRKEAAFNGLHVQHAGTTRSQPSHQIGSAARLLIQRQNSTESKLSAGREVVQSC